LLFALSAKSKKKITLRALCLPRRSGRSYWGDSAVNYYVKRRTVNMTDKALFQQLAEGIGAGESKLMPEIFEALIDENEARVLLAAAPPATIDEISEKTGIPGDNIEKMIDPLFKKGLIFKSKKEGATRYYRVRSVPQLHDATAVSLDASRDFLDLWKDYMATEWDGYGRRLEAILPQPVVRVIPVNISIEQQTQILAFDDVKSIVEGARNLAVTKCSCRVIDGKCGRPLEVCIQVDRAADYAIERGTGRKLNKEETITILKMCEEEGLVHVADNRRQPGHVICNCCDDCCLNWPSIKAGSKKWVVPSRFEAVVDAELCSGCETCLDRCFFDAISIEDDISTVDSEKCMGCGVCAVTCPTEAMSLKEVRPADFVPA
jgi:Fe-S-cluster-containing hydrogenase component 2/DNA-binding MarR family transcriptional regulator